MPTVKLVNYLSEIDYAAGQIIDLIWRERKEVESLEAEIDTLKRHVEREYLAAQQIQQFADDDDDLMFGAGRYWDTYFGEDKQRHSKSEHLVLLSERLSTHEFSVSSLSASLLQYAKQGLSLAFGEFDKWPQGKLVGSQNLKMIVRQGRNQSMHWEEGKFSQDCVKCLSTLVNDFGQQFASYSQKNLAFEIVSLLGWRSFAAFKADLLSM
jgi:hypothetical protein